MPRECFRAVLSTRRFVYTLLLVCGNMNDQLYKYEVRYKIAQDQTQVGTALGVGYLGMSSMLRHGHADALYTRL